MKIFYPSVLFTPLAILFIGSLVFVSHNFAFAASSATVSATAKISVCGNSVKEGGEQCDGSDFGGKQCSNLGFDGGTMGCSASCEYNTSSCTTSAEETATPLFSSDIGGSYTVTDSSDSSEISLPTNFYSDDVRLDMFAFDKSSIQSSEPAPSGKSFIGKVYDFQFVDSNGNTVSTLSKPATVTLTYADTDTSGIDISTLAPYRRETNDTVWHSISSYSVNTTNKTITFDTDSFSSFTIFGSAPTPSTPAPSGGGGGGGGGGFISPSVTGATFAGKAYPLSKVIILKDAQIAAQTVAGNDANFSFNLTGLTPGSYMFSLYAEDKDGLKSPLFTFPITVQSGAVTNVGNIFIAPTLSANKTEVQQGGILALFGQTAPNSKVTITVNSATQLLEQVNTGIDGVYLYDLDTSVLAFGDHTARSKTALAAGIISGDSPVVAFSVGNQNVAAPLPKNALRGDLNGDGRVNIIDFSILAYWYGRSNPPARVDLNGDGKVDLVDFSILAFYWTG